MEHNSLSPEVYTFSLRFSSIIVANKKSNAIQDFSFYGDFFFFPSWLLPAFVLYPGHEKPPEDDFFSLHLPSLWCLLHVKTESFNSKKLSSFVSLIIVFHHAYCFYFYHNNIFLPSVIIILSLLLQYFLPLDFSLELPTLGVYALHFGKIACSFSLSFFLFPRPIFCFSMFKFF